MARTLRPDAGALGALRDFPLYPPLQVARALWRHRWSDVGFAHWAYDPEVVAGLLPKGLSVDTFDGQAWVGLVPFRLRIALGRSPAVPWMCRFPEINVRTYVLGPGGVPGVWFLSLDASRLLPVAFARRAYRLNYCWSKMRFRRAGCLARYESRRRWPAPRNASCMLGLSVGDAIEERDLSDLDRFLTCRWIFYCRLHGLSRGLVSHDPWPLRRARVTVVETGLLRAHGLPEPAGSPVAHFSDGVEVLMGWPQRTSAHDRIDSISSITS